MKLELQETWILDWNSPKDRYDRVALHLASLQSEQTSVNITLRERNLVYLAPTPLIKTLDTAPLRLYADTTDET